MGRVFVAGSINMDVVATADRHPKVGETIAGSAVHYFPGGKGANQAVASAKLGAPTTLIPVAGANHFTLLDALRHEFGEALPRRLVDRRDARSASREHAACCEKYHDFFGAFINNAEKFNNLFSCPF